MYHYHDWQNVCGTLTALISIASSAVAPNARTAAIYYFIAALFVLLACLDTYFALPLNVSSTDPEYQLGQICKMDYTT